MWASLQGKPGWVDPSCVRELRLNSEQDLKIMRMSRNPRQRAAKAASAVLG